MINKTSLAVLIAGLTLAGSSAATAQTQASTSMFFVDVNVGAQTQSRTLNSSTSFPLYGETAIINAAQSIGSGGLFDISGGYRILPRVSVALGFSVFSKSGDGAISASIPSPLVINKPAISTTTSTDLTHREVGTHLMAVYTRPIDDKISVAAFIGPSFFHLTQDILSATVPTGTQNLNVKSQSEKATAAGANIGVSANYMYKPNYGGGIFIRYAGASVDLPSAKNVKVGGFQIGIGARLRFSKIF